MPFISVSDGLVNKSATSVENKFITKYLPALNPDAVKAYLYTLFVCQNGAAYSFTDVAAALSFTEEKLKDCYEYLDELELIAITSRTPFEIKILEAENISGAPKKIKPEKYADFTKTVQSILKGRMVSTNEFMDYFCLLEDYGFDQNALIMIISYCVHLHGDKIRPQYIKKVAKSFADEGLTSAKKVDEKLSAYTSSTPALIKLFSAAGIKKQPDVEDDKLYKKWTKELGFGDEAIICAAKCFKAKTCEKLDMALEELFKNRRFDAKEIEDYCKNKNSIYAVTLDIAKNLGVYMQNSAPYVENYVNVWCNKGFSFECLKEVSAYLFKTEKHSFEEMDAFLQKLYDGGVVADKSVKEYLETRNAEDKFIKTLLECSGLTRKIVPWDRESLAKWRSWNFSDEMLLEAARLSSGKSNPMAYMNGILSAWKADGVYSKEKLASASAPVARKADKASDDGGLRAEIERHYFDLRHAAEQRAEAAVASATADGVYGNIKKQLNELSIKLAFAEIRDKAQAAEISKRIKELETEENKRLAELCIDKDDFVPRYSCPVCNDTGYDKYGKPCACMKKFISTIE